MTISQNYNHNRDHYHFRNQQSPTMAQLEWDRPTWRERLDDWGAAILIVVLICFAFFALDVLFDTTDSAQPIHIVTTQGETHQ